MAEQAESLEFTPEQLQQHPDAFLLLMLLGGLMIVIAAGCLVMAVYTIVRLVQGKPLLRIEPWTPRVWGLIDLFLVGVVLVLAQSFSLGLWSRLTDFNLSRLRDEGDFPLSAMAVGSLSYLVVMLLTIGWMMLRYRTSLAHIGFTFRRFRAHVGLGIGAALLSLPVVYLVMGLVSTGLDQEYDHPLLRGMTEEGTLSAFLLGLFCAVIAAPISEEFLFRVLLQGWLQSLPFSWDHFWWLIGASERRRGTIIAAETLTLVEPGLDAPAGALAAALPTNPYLPPVPSASIAPVEAAIEPPLVSPLVPPLVAETGLPVMPAPPVWPVFVSGTLFGLAHWGYGLSFVPLILLGIILGFLYRATHSIWPSLVVHFILNLIAITSLGILTYVKEVVQ